MMMKRCWVLLLCAPLAGAPRQVTVRIERQVQSWPLETYVAAVLAGECATFTEPEALKAMAVTARTWAVHHLGRHRAEGFDLCDTTHCQYLRINKASDRHRAAVEDTEGELLWHEGEPAAAFHHAHCGGTVAAAVEIWPGLRAPYLRFQEDSFCTAAGRAAWSSQVGREDVRRALNLREPVVLQITRRTPSGRVAEIEVNGRRWSARKLESVIGHTLGWHLLRSTRYEVAAMGEHFIFRGYGSGHGAGLCQAGALARAAQGHSFRQILDFYFPGTVLGISARGFNWARMPGERVEVWSTRPQQDQAVVAKADRALQEAERRAGFEAAFRPRVRIYPSVASFRNATGEPGWVAASAAGRTVRMQPRALLGSSGEFYRILLHEMLHLLIESRAHPNLPPWFREGLVMCLAESAGAPRAASRPPAESAFSSPRSADEMRRAHQAAHARVRALMENHGRETVLGWLGRGLPRELAGSGK